MLGKVLPPRRQSIWTIIGCEHENKPCQKSILARNGSVPGHNFEYQELEAVYASRGSSLNKHMVKGFPSKEDLSATDLVLENDKSAMSMTFAAPSHLTLVEQSTMGTLRALKLM